MKNNRYSELSDRVAAMLADSARDASAMAALCAEVQSAAKDATKEAADARDAALDPRLDSKQVADLRRVRADSEFQAERMVAAAAALQAEVAALTAAEAEARKVAAYDAADLRAQEVADKIAAEYPALSCRLMGIISEIGEATARVVAVNRDLPQGREPLQGPEGRARGFNDCAGTKHRQEVARIVNSMIVPFAPRPYYAWPVEGNSAINADDAGGFSPYQSWPSASDLAKGSSSVALDRCAAPPTFGE